MQSTLYSRKPQDLLNLIQPCTQVLISMHHNPDPDAMASALAIQYMVSHHFRNKKCVLASSGVIGRTENRALVWECGIELVPFSTIDLEQFPGVILVDCQYSQANHSLPQLPMAIIDHHPLRERDPRIKFQDIRPEYGASSTIVFGYLQELGVPIDANLATALLYGIRTDTMELGRSTLDLEFEVYTELLKLADKAKLARITHAPVNREYYRDIKEALDKAFLLGPDILVAPQETVVSPDINAEVAEFFMRHKDLNWVFAMGNYHDNLYISVRCRNKGLDAGAMVRESLGDLGPGGGHGQAAGAKIPVNPPTDEHRRKISDQVCSKIADYFGLDLAADRSPFLSPQT